MSLFGSQVEVSVLLKTKEYSHIINRSNAITANTSNTNIKMSIVPTNVHSCGKINIHISILLLGFYYYSTKFLNSFKYVCK